MRHDRKLGVVIATGNVEFSQGPRTLLADTVTYNQRTDTATATGNVSLLEPSGDVMFAEYVEFSGNLKDGIARGVRMRLVDDSRIAAAGGRRIGGTRTDLRKVVYSPCKPCRENPERAPIWQIKSYRLERDIERQELQFSDSFLEIFGVPVAYLPYFSAPDPSVKRRTGLLIPSYGSDSELGTIVRVPYYIAISPQQDATLTPIYTGNEGPVLLTEYRHRFAGGMFDGRGSVTRASVVEGDKQLRGHFIGGAKFDVNDTWRGGIKAAFSSDDTYLRRYDFGSETTLTSRAFLEGFRGRNYGGAQAIYFQDLRSDVDQETVPFAFPILDYNFVGEPGRFGGRWALDANVLALTRDTGVNTRRLSLKSGWRLPSIGRVGEVYSLFANLQTDAYWTTEIPDPTDATIKTSDVSGRAFPQLGADWRFPLVRRGKQSSQLIEPVAGIVLAPNGGNPDEIRNEDSLDFELDDTNIFRANRFTGLDRVEGGSRFYYGLKGALYGSEGGFATAFIGQSYRLRADSLFSAGSGLEENFSDLVGRVEISPKKYLHLLYRFRIDNDALNPRRNEVSARAGPSMLNFAATYLFIEQQNPDISDNDREELTASITSRITERWSLNSSMVRDLFSGENRSQSFGAVYSDDCLTFNASFSRSFTQDRDVKSTDTVFFSITLRNLGSIGASRTVRAPEDPNEQ